MTIKSTYNDHLDYVTVELPSGAYLEHRQSDNLAGGYVELVYTVPAAQVDYYTTLHGLVEMRDALRNLLDTPEDGV